MLIGSIEEKDLFMNSVLSNVFGTEVYLEKGESLYSLWMRNYSDLDGDRHYDEACQLMQGPLESCIDTAERVCVVDRSRLPEPYSRI